MTVVICMLAVVILNAVINLRLVLVYISFGFYSVSIFSVQFFFFGTTFCTQILKVCFLTSHSL